MESYGVPVKSNKFDISMFDDDDDPYEILKKKEEEQVRMKEEAKKAKEKQLTKAAKSNKNKKAQAVQQEQKGKSVETSAPARKDDNRPPRIANQQQQKRDDRSSGATSDKNHVKFSRDGAGGKDFEDRRERRNNFTPANEFSSGRGFSSDRSDSRGGFDRSDAAGRGRGRGRGRGGRGGGAGRGREYERRSGSDKTNHWDTFSQSLPAASRGVKPVEKRDGKGPHNWGTVQDDVEAQMNESNVSEEAGNTSEWNPTTFGVAEDTENQDPNEKTKQPQSLSSAVVKPTSEGGEGNEEKEEKEEEGPKEMTLDEYKAMQATSKKPDEFNIRRPNEGCDMKQWKNTYVLKKKPVNSDSEEEEDSDEESDRPQKQLLNIEITFSDNPRRGGAGGGRGRGGRGRGRGGAGGGDRGGRGGGGGGNDRGGHRGGGRGGSGPPRSGRKEIVPKVDDPLEFPSITSS
ncbi:uncharacterized protein LOC141900677 isoform X2 [Tubulanus polymorphus]|uniref:uncharacterized protein LOC141900677 isoform X2 n=1 Tax=Tubulanus polymorphus TaxID=672921 RepID=UPI003DA3FFD2